jgi:hypothetical protein
MVKMENQANQPIPDLSKGFISPNKTDFIYFDPNNGEVALVEDMKPSEDIVCAYRKAVGRCFNTPEGSISRSNLTERLLLDKNKKAYFAKS